MAFKRSRNLSGCSDNLLGAETLQTLRCDAGAAVRLVAVRIFVSGTLQRAECRLWRVAFCCIYRAPAS